MVMTDKTNKNPLLCDPVEGVCGIPDSAGSAKIKVQKCQTG